MALDNERRRGRAGGARRLFAVPLFDIMDKIVGFNRWIAWGVLMEGEEGYAAPRKGQE
jgi:hypothetical protein